MRVPYKDTLTYNYYGDIVGQSKKFKQFMTECKNFEKFEELVKLGLKGITLGEKKYPKDKFLKTDMINSVKEEIRDIVVYLFFLYLKIDKLEKGVTQDLYEWKNK